MTEVQCRNILQCLGHKEEIKKEEVDVELLEKSQLAQKYWELGEYIPNDNLGGQYKTLRSPNYDFMTDTGEQYDEVDYEPEELTEEELRVEPLLWEPLKEYNLYFGYGASYVETEEVIQFDTRDTVDTPDIPDIDIIRYFQEPPLIKKERKPIKTFVCKSLPWEVIKEIRSIPPSNIKAIKLVIEGQDTVDYYWRNGKCFLKKGVR